MQQQNLLVKIIILGVLLFLFAIGLGFVKIIVYERQSYQNHVIRDIERNQIGKQQVISPFIAVPYKESHACDVVKNPELKGQLCTRQAEQLFFPNQVSWDGKFEVSNDTYQRTIYHATSYTTQLQAKGHFPTPQLKQHQYDWQAARFILPIRDLRGIHQKPILTINQVKYQLDFPQQGNNASLNYLEAPLVHFNPEKFDFNLDVHLEGLQSFALIPTIENTIFAAQGNWADAKYFGDSLPQTNSSRTGEFRASWQNITLGYQNRLSLIHCWNENSCQNKFSSHLAQSNVDGTDYKSALTASGFAVEFIKPVNIYSQTDRAIKYGWMITLISFGCFFLFEVTKGLRIHPIQYLLVGVAQSVFFVLLLSLSEQFNFLLAYNIASIASIGLMSWYLGFVLKGWKNTVIFTVLLGSLYTVMYVLLQSSEKTFLMGSVFSFVLVAGVMFITRHIDWYQLSYRK